MHLLIQPGDGISLLLEGIKGAKKSIEIVIFRFDERELELALKAAVTRGVFVHALIAYTNRGGEKNLRKLEARLLAAGVNVARTADDLARYHAKYMIIDRRMLYLMSFNYTHLDINNSRSFGLILKNKKIVREAVGLFEADTTRQSYTPEEDDFIVSPANARKQLLTFIAGARKQLLIYDDKLTDSQMLRLLQERAKAGIEVKVIGRLGKQMDIQAVKLSKLRLHAQVLIRDRRRAFLGSQSLRKAELDDRREVGLITRDPQVVRGLLTTFEADWSASNSVKELPVEQQEVPPVPLATALKEAVKDAVKEVVAEGAAPQDVKEVVKEAVKEVVKELESAA